MGILKSIASIVGGIIVVMLVWYAISAFFLFPIDANVFSEPKNGLYEHKLSIYHTGHTEMRDINFKIAPDECYFFFYDPKIDNNDPVKDCRITNDFSSSSINIQCSVLQQGSTLEISWMYSDNIDNCSIFISYRPDLPTQLLPFPLENKEKIHFFNSSNYNSVRPLTFSELTNCTGVCIRNITPTRNFFYAGTPILVNFEVLSQNDYNNSDIIAEWDSSLNITPYEDKLDLIANSKVNWYVWKGSWIYNETYKNITTRVALRYGNDIVESDVISVVKSDQDLFRYSKVTSRIFWNDSVVKDFIIQKIPRSILLSDDIMKSQFALNLTRQTIRKPIKTQDKTFYDTNNLSSLDVFERREGTSSEYAVFYSMLTRLLSIPSKISYHDGQFFVQIYLNDKWQITNPYDSAIDFICEDCEAEKMEDLDW